MYFLLSLWHLIPLSYTWPSTSEIIRKCSLFIQKKFLQSKSSSHFWCWKSKHHCLTDSFLSRLTVKLSEAACVCTLIRVMGNLETTNVNCSSWAKTLRFWVLFAGILLVLLWDNLNCSLCNKHKWLIFCGNHFYEAL